MRNNIMFYKSIYPSTCMYMYIYMHMYMRLCVNVHETMIVKVSSLNNRLHLVHCIILLTTSLHFLLFRHRCGCEGALRGVGPISCDQLRW